MKSNFFKELENIIDILIKMNDDIDKDAIEGQKEAHDVRLQVERRDKSISKEEKRRFTEMSKRKMNDVKMRRLLYDKLSEATVQAFEEFELHTDS